MVFYDDVWGWLQQGVAKVSWSAMCQSRWELTLNDGAHALWHWFKSGSRDGQRQLMMTNDSGYRATLGPNMSELEAQNYFFNRRGRGWLRQFCRGSVACCQRCFSIVRYNHWEPTGENEPEWESTFFISHHWSLTNLEANLFVHCLITMVGSLFVQ